MIQRVKYNIVLFPFQITYKSMQQIEEQDTPSGASGYTDSIKIYKNVVVPKFRPNETSDSVTKLLEKFKVISSA